MPDAGNIPQIRTATLCLLNSERAERGRRVLRSNRTLRVAAQTYSEQMVRDSFFDHVSPTGGTLLGRIRGATDYLRGTAAWSLGENLAWGSGERGTPGETVVAWMNSPGHRHNILDRGFRDIGIGVALGAPAATHGLPAATYTTEFGHRVGDRARASRRRSSQR
ncbi:MAG: CAP domain-containing protein [Actinomycetota bacterium]|nr:CAP domain-containing protein [Actinomycetota bacterium]